MEERPYVLLSELYRLDRLPGLPNYIPWSMRLLSDILKKSGEWVPIGSYDEIFVPAGEKIQDEIQFIAYILHRPFKERPS